jgi:hypothetical protein
MFEFNSRLFSRAALSRAASVLIIPACIASLHADEPQTARAGPAATWAAEAEHVRDAYVIKAGETVSSLSRVNQDVVIRGEVDGSVNLIAGDLYVLGHVKGPVSVVGGDVTVLGTVDNDVTVIGGDIRAAGEIHGQTSVVGGSTIDAPGASDAPGTVENPDDEGATVSFKLHGRDQQWDWHGRFTDDDTSSWGIGFLFGLVLLISWLATSSMVALVVPETLNRATALLSRETAKVFAVGILFWVVFGIALLLAALLSVVLIGLPLLGGLLLLGLIVRWIGLAAVCLWIGRAVCRAIQKKSEPGLWTPLVTGVVLLAAVTLIPFAGFVLWVLLFIPTAGAVTLAFHQRRTSTIPPPPSPTFPTNSLTAP